ncbi:hypothetical protein PR202_ga06963 [Eleusine coracana subsp. coracana]|uniref:Protein phosphatase 1 regulatory subunit pprA n=1 Tax=Eleusine coracana subsp. coracana TaxID=191504 RepID=A0AAV5BXE3_ELECO|nr:hypothetical protein PR202_ga06963 [Eleusine coracana subsp. coracana]
MASGEGAIDPQAAASGAEADAEMETEEQEGPVVCLDLTSYQLHDLNEVEIPPTLEELDLTANRLSSVDPRIGRLTGLRKLSFRQNLLDDAAVAPLSSWETIAGLQELVLRDNKLTRIPDASIFKGLLVFDVSFNEISSLSGLSKVSSTLKELYVSKNEVGKMEELEHFHALEILELGSNRLRVMENLENLTNLQELWLGRNRIRTVNLCGLKLIKKLSLQSNRLTSMDGFQDCIALEELYLSHNGIQKMEGLSTLQNLRVLDVSSNKITAIENIESLTRLEDLWLNDNQIPSLDGIEAALAGSRETLTTIYLERNPCVSKTPNYSATLKRTFPNLEQIDSDIIA